MSKRVYALENLGLGSSKPVRTVDSGVTWIQQEARCPAAAVELQVAWGCESLDVTFCVIHAEHISAVMTAVTGAAM
jgi:hypothetical protein